ncbi:uncharacterized protein [Clytia hemisphaerica]
MSHEAGFLVDFPYTNDQGKFLLRKDKQRKNLCGEFCSTTLCCRGQNKSELAYRMMFWLGIILAVIAITVTLIKELFEGVKGEDTILHLSIGELVLAILSVTTTLSKHLIKHNDVIVSQKRIRSAETKKDQQKALTQRRKVQIILTTTLLLFVGAIVTGFTILMAKDPEEHAYLTYTKFITVLTLFLSIILDGVINDILSDYHSLVQIDQCKLVIHQLNLELRDALNVVGDKERANQLTSYVDNHEIFCLSDHMIFLAPNEGGPTVTNGDHPMVESTHLIHENEANDWV